MRTPVSYSGISIINHWVTALFVIVMLVLGAVASQAPNYGIEDYVLRVHIGLGFFVFFFVLWRVAYRLYEGFPDNLGQSKFEKWAAFLVHRLLLIFLTIQVFTGPLYIFTEGEGMNVFGWFTIKLPLQSLSSVHDLAELIHVILGIYIIPALIMLHFLGAAKHYLTQTTKAPADM